jgi:hypothetical protein
LGQASPHLESYSGTKAKENQITFVWEQVRYHQPMALNLVDLDDVTRPYMLSELDRDLAEDKLYVGKYLSQVGIEKYPVLLREAIERGTDESLADALSAPGMFMSHYQRRKQSGGFSQAKVPYTANKTLAEGEFNRFYLRGLCKRAIDKKVHIEVYRARESSNPRPESQSLIGANLDPATLLEDLRENTGVDTALGLPPGPNSGLSGRMSSKEQAVSDTAP